MISNSKIKWLKQNKFYYRYSSFNKLALSIKPGETVVVEVPDTFEGKVKTEKPNTF